MSSVSKHVQLLLQVITFKLSITVHFQSYSPILKYRNHLLVRGRGVHYNPQIRCCERRLHTPRLSHRDSNQYTSPLTVSALLLPHNQDHEILILDMKWWLTIIKCSWFSSSWNNTMSKQGCIPIQLQASRRKLSSCNQLGQALQGAVTSFVKTRKCLALAPRYCCHGNQALYYQWLCSCWGSSHCIKIPGLINL